MQSNNEDAHSDNIQSSDDEMSVPLHRPKRPVKFTEKARQVH
jgi:hypothetical protein